eukprot:7199690-Karenia_brevis.AAC.1
MGWGRRCVFCLRLVHGTSCKVALTICRASSPENNKSAKSTRFKNDHRLAPHRCYLFRHIQL